MGRMTLLLPVFLPRETALIGANLRGFSGFDIVLFGYWSVPEGTDPAVVRETHESEAQAKLYELAAEFSRAGAPTDVRLHFGPTGEHMDALQERTAEEVEADAVVVPNRITGWNNVLVPLRDDRNADRIVEFLDAFAPETIFVIELFHAATDPGDAEAAREMLDGVELALLDRGFTESDVEATVEVVDDPEAAIIERAGRHNVVVIGETEELTDRFLGPTYERLAENIDVPVVVVRDGAHSND